MEDDPLQTAIKWLERVSKGTCPELEAITLDAIQIVEARTGFLRCSFAIPNLTADKDGNWQVGAISTVIDCVGALAVYSFNGNPLASVDLTISFYSTAKIQEEVEIEAKVVEDRGKLTSVLVVVRRKDNGQQIALGKQWMISKI